MHDFLLNVAHVLASLLMVAYAAGISIGLVGWPARLPGRMAVVLGLIGLCLATSPVALAKPAPKYVVSPDGPAVGLGQHMSFAPSLQGEPWHPVPTGLPCDCARVCVVPDPADRAAPARKCTSRTKGQRWCAVAKNSSQVALCRPKT